MDSRELQSILFINGHFVLRPIPYKKSVDLFAVYKCMFIRGLLEIREKMYLGKKTGNKQIDE